MNTARLLSIAMITLLAAAPAAAATQFGAYVGPGCVGRKAMPRFERFVGRRVERTVDALNQRNWAEMISSIDWATRCWKGSGIALTLSVPMLPFSGEGTLREGAQGKYDPVFVKTAAALVRDGHADAIVRIGWEFNGEWMPWNAAKDPEAYRAYFRRIVRLMRAAPGQRFRFEWCPNIGRHAIAPDLAYPGDDVVDVIGLDVYNEVWGFALANPSVRFAWYKNQPYGLAWHRDFAARHRKPIAFSEWGSGTRTDGKGAGDDPTFISGMAAWFRETRPLYQSWWEVRKADYDYTLAGSTSPLAARAYRAAFGPGSSHQN